MLTPSKPISLGDIMKPESKEKDSLGFGVAFHYLLIIQSSQLGFYYWKLKFLMWFWFLFELVVSVP